MTASLSSMGIVNALGNSREAIWENLYQSPESGLSDCDWVIGTDSVKAGSVSGELPSLPSELANLDCRNNRLALAALEPIESTIRDSIDAVGPDRVGAVVGTSTTGIRSAEEAIDEWTQTGELPDDFHYNQMEMGGLAQFVREYFGLNGPAYTVSTSCSSSAKVFASARSLLECDVADAVVVGGADSLCGLTLNGFNSLQLLSEQTCNPMAVDRDGINIGEGAAFFLMTRDGGSVEVAGVGEAADAYSMNAPDPEGEGARASMSQALEEANLEPGNLDYLNLHGTATPQNDAMESKAVRAELGSDVPCSSTKAFFGHALGAAGALETAVCWMMLNRAGDEGLPMVPHLWEGPWDEELETIELVEEPTRVAGNGPFHLMTNSFAFGGHNCSVVLRGGSDS